MSASQSEQEGCGERSMVSAMEAGPRRLRGASTVNNDAYEARADGIPAAKFGPSRGEPEQQLTTANDNLLPVCDGHPHESVESLVPQISMEDVRSAGFRGFNGLESSLEDPVSPSLASVCTRPIAWRLLLGALSDDAAAWAAVLHQQRAQYNAWKRECMGPQNPSSQSNCTSDAALLRGIEKDICRTRSELAFFAVGSMAHQWMRRILFVHAKLHPDVGYMQGMNEILAPILFVYGNDPDEAWALETEADAFYSFQSIIASIKILYAPAPSDPSKSGADLQMCRLMLLLRQHDPTVWQHLNSIGVTPDLFSLRWYMTLLGREFPMPTTLRIWDTLLSDPKRFSLLHYVNCALIRCRRSSLLRLGFAGALKCLQSAPPNDIDVDQLLSDAKLMRARDRSVDQARLSTESAVPVEVDRS